MSASYVNIQGGTTFVLDLKDNQSLQNNQIRLICKTLGGAITIQMPKISDIGNSIDAKIFIDDGDDNASVNNITIVCDPADTIQNGANYVISTNGGKIEIYIASKTEYGVIVSGGGVGGTQNLAQVLAVGNSTGDAPITAPDGLSTLKITTGGVFDWTSNAGAYDGSWIYGDADGNYLGFNNSEVFVDGTQVHLKAGTGYCLVSTANAYIYNSVGGFFVTELNLATTKYFNIRALASVIKHNVAVTIDTPFINSASGNARMVFNGGFGAGAVGLAGAVSVFSAGWLYANATNSSFGFGATSYALIDVNKVSIAHATLIELNCAKINISSVPVGIGSVSVGELYVDTEANITASAGAGLFVARRIS